MYYNILQHYPNGLQLFWMKCSSIVLDQHFPAFLLQRNFILMWNDN